MLTITKDQTEWTTEQLEALRAVVVGSPKPAELKQLLHTCQKLGLDPFTKQLYAISRGGKLTIQVGIDGFRTIASRWAAERGLLIGNKPPTYFDSKGAEFPFPPKDLAAVRWTVTISGPDGMAAEQTAVLSLAEYGQSGGMWKKMPAVMLAKCAEAVTLRAAAPEALGGVYSTDEFDPLTSSGVHKTGKPVPVIDAKKRLLMFLCEAGLEDDAARRTAISIWSEHGSPTRPLSPEALDEMLSTAHNSISSGLSDAEAEPFPEAGATQPALEEGPYSLDDTDNLNNEAKASLQESR